MKHYFILLIVAATLAGCHDNPIDELVRELPDKREQINITAQIEQSNVDKTRGTPINSVQQMTSMSVFCAATGAINWANNVSAAKMFNTQLVRNVTTQRWDYSSTPVNWGPTSSSDKYTFFAYAPFGQTSNGIAVQGSPATTGIPTLIYTAPTDVTLQPDLMFAVPRYNLVSATSTVALKMMHALTCVGFQIKGNGERVKSITISGTYAAGTAKIDGSSIIWSYPSQPPTPINYSPSLNFDAGQTYVTAGSTMSTNLIKGDGYLMMVPQVLGPNAKLTLTLDDTSTREISLNSQTWIAGQKITYNIIITPLGILTISPSAYYIPAAGTTHKTDNFDVACNPTTMTWQLGTQSSWLKLTTNADGSGAASSISKTGPSTVYTVASANTIAASRLGTIYAFGNTTNVVARITQLKPLNLASVVNGGAYPVSNMTYVGAFWRGAETGERLIRIHAGTGSNMLGTWSASVVWKDANWADDDIRFSTTTSLDTKVSYTTDSNPDPAESFKVTDKWTIASGTVTSGNYMYFRIGLMTAHNAAVTPARYAVVELQYGNHLLSQIIVIRQGEGDDYIMRANDLLTGAASIINRPLARAFSPYNLTQKSLTAWPGGSSYTNHVVLAKNGGRFTDFPSQGGALIAWASTQHPRLALHPTNSITAINSWSDSAPSAFWRSGIPGSTVADTHETCPVGYRRVNDGSEIAITGLDFINSELRQSLMNTCVNGLNSAQTNTLFGCYADGYFDRRRVVTSPSGNVWTTAGYNVANPADPRNANLAYKGTVVYNPVTWASIFFPCAGNRNNTNGWLENTGRLGLYWTSSSLATASYASVFMISSGTPAGYGYESIRHMPGSIRCIKIP